MSQSAAIAIGLAVPTVHLNGTHADDLRDALFDAVVAIRKAQEALNRTAPHARDYHPQGTMIRKAMAEHFSRCDRLASVSGELHAIAECLA